MASIDGTISPGETMLGDNYLDVGASAVEAIITAIMASRLERIGRVLDIPCGHGRVLRHLVKLFPAAKFDVCDLDAEGVAFCADQFGAGIITAHLDLTETSFPAQYDLIWIGSLFTHLPEATTQRYLEHLAKQLTPTGIIVATFHGRWAERMQTLMPYTDAERWSAVERGFNRWGYGYVDYAPGRGHDFVAGSYGISAVRPDHLMQMVQKIPGVRVFHFAEKGWSNNHDVLAFGKPCWTDAPGA
ncbi:SAM-dependent methyltransferase [Novosphingobium chloroacetimidivorans]|uniref:SAM-dependent methyltransferase n=1 Tax=Novosphingobium chloroacetimidivorans TaxID=1428314 RepID=A0A7W7NUA7_9SPHN|nr:class I SAM-dependent methyltransferase [Novosphingobium chloroacetimidivorans]MBB4857016.1 SAM-dependent methyltransferase [Novosphingobium chloroacetimidivorans]